MTNEEMTGIMDPRIPDDAVFSDEGFFLMRMPFWNKYAGNQEELIAIHDCDKTSQEAFPFFVSMPICDPCNFCGRIASDKLQTIMVLHNGHY